MLHLDPAATALVVVDMQNDFVRQGAPLEVPDARDTIDNHQRLLKRFRDRKRVVVFTRFIAGPERTLIWNWSPVLAPPICCCWPGFMRAYGDVAGPRDAAAVIDELAPLPTEIQVDKYNYGAFHRTNLLDCLQCEIGARKVDRRGGDALVRTQRRQNASGRRSDGRAAKAAPARLDACTVSHGYVNTILQGPNARQ